MPSSSSGRTRESYSWSHCFEACLVHPRANCSGEETGQRQNIRGGNVFTMLVMKCLAKPKAVEEWMNEDWIHVFLTMPQDMVERHCFPDYYHDKRQHTVLTYDNAVWYSTPLMTKSQHFRGPPAYHRQWQPSGLGTGLRSWHRQRRPLGRYPLEMTWRLNMTLWLLLLDYNQIGEDLMLDVSTNWFAQHIHDHILRNNILYNVIDHAFMNQHRSHPC